MSWAIVAEPGLLKAFSKCGDLDADGKERKPTDYVVGCADGTKIMSINTAWKLACGDQGLRFQDFRREAGSTRVYGTEALLPER